MDEGYTVAEAVMQVISNNAEPIVYTAVAIAVAAFVFHLLFYALSRLVKWSTPRD